MKTKYAFLATIIISIVTLTVLGQNTSRIKNKPVVKKNDVSTMMGKPVYESTVDSLRTKVWIITQKKNAAMMKTVMGKQMSKSKDDKLVMNNESKDKVMLGTHCIIIDVTNITNGKQIADTSAKVEIVSPTKKLSSVNFVSMMSYFGGGATLGEKGNYLFTINVNIGASYKTSQFKYKLR